MKQNNEAPNMEFQEEKSEQSSQYLQPQTPKIIQWAIKYSGGHIKDEKQANYVLIGFVALAVIISLFLILGGGSEQETFVPAAEAPAAEVIPPAEF